MDSNTKSSIENIINNNKIVLFMKGDKQFPQCGFSGRAIQILNAIGCKDFFTVNVLTNQEIREGIKEYSNWPTIPQLYVNGEFIGGADIMYEMYQEGELSDLLNIND